MRGTVRRLKADLGFGFIRPDAGPPDFFFHRSQVVTTRDQSFDTLSEGQAVEFEEDDSRPEKGPRAKNVTAA